LTTKSPQEKRGEVHGTQNGNYHGGNGELLNQGRERNDENRNNAEGSDKGCHSGGKEPRSKEEGIVRLNRNLALRTIGEKMLLSGLKRVHLDYCIISSGDFGQSGNAVRARSRGSEGKRRGRDCCWIDRPNDEVGCFILKVAWGKDKG